MTAPTTLTASISSELTLMVRLGSSITLSRPTPRTATGSSSWLPLAEDLDVGILPHPRCTLKLRLRAVDVHGLPMFSPPWLVDVSTRVGTGSWQSLSTLDAPACDHLTTALDVTTVPRTYRITVRLAGSDVSATHELVVAQAGSSAADDDDDHDVLYDPEDDLLPPPKPVGDAPGGPIVIPDLAATG